jgi:hypothetical protein
MPVTHVVVGDLVVISVLFGVATVTMERRYGWMAALSLAGAAAGTLEPSWAPAILSLVTIVGGVLSVLLVWRRARLDP